MPAKNARQTPGKPIYAEWAEADRPGGMKSKSFPLAGVQLVRTSHTTASARPSPDRSYSVHPPDGASVTLPANFDADTLFTLLTVLRDALR